MEGGHLGLLVFTALTSLLSTSCVNVTDKVQATLEEQAQKLNYLEALILQQSSKLTNADAMIEQLNAAVDNLRSAGYESLTPLVAFDVQYSDDPHHNISDGDVMIFDDVNTNVGKGYNVTSGSFRAPVSGVYVFNMKVTPSPKGHVYVYLIVNGQRHDSVDANDPTESETGDSFKIVQLKAGNMVWMKKSYGEPSVRGWVHTRFSGFLLRAYP